MVLYLAIILVIVFFFHQRAIRCLVTFLIPIPPFEIENFYYHLVLTIVWVEKGWMC